MSTNIVSVESMKVIMLGIQSRMSSEFDGPTLIMSGKSAKGQPGFAIVDKLPPYELNIGKVILENDIKSQKDLNPQSYREVCSILKENSDFVFYVSKDTPNHLKEKLDNCIVGLLRDAGFSSQIIDKMVTRDYKSSNKT